MSKLKTVEYLYRYQGISITTDAVYRFLDKLGLDLKKTVEEIGFNHTKRVLKGEINIVFYDMTTLYFEASDEDDLRKIGFSKDGKHSNPQIYLGLLVGLGGYAIGYDIFEGNIYEGHTLIPMIKKISNCFDLNKPVVVADVGLLTSANISDLEENGYEYILGARIKGSGKEVKKILDSTVFKNGDHIVIPDDHKASRLIVQYSDDRAKKIATTVLEGWNDWKNRSKQENLQRTTLTIGDITST